jgi:hypothetical protein
MVSGNLTETGTKNPINANLWRYWYTNKIIGIKISHLTSHCDRLMWISLQH